MAQILSMDDLTSTDTLKAVVAEAIAVLVLVLVGTGIIVVAGAASISAIVAIAVGMGLTYMALVALTMGISGGHINPAVTFAAVITGRMSLPKGLVYVAGQVVGAIIGSLILELVLVDGIQGALGAVAWSPGVVENLGGAVVIELILGSVLVLVMLVLIVGPGASNASPFAPVGPGLIVLVGTLLAFALTGAAMNPARALGPAIVADVSGVAGVWADHWIYWVGPLGGAAIAGVIYDGIFTGRMANLFKS